MRPVYTCFVRIRIVVMLSHSLLNVVLPQSSVLTDKLVPAIYCTNRATLGAIRAPRFTAVIDASSEPSASRFTVPIEPPLKQFEHQDLLWRSTHQMITSRHQDYVPIIYPFEPSRHHDCMSSSHLDQASEPSALELSSHSKNSRVPSAHSAAYFQHRSYASVSIFRAFETP